MAKWSGSAANSVSEGSGSPTDSSKVLYISFTCICRTRFRSHRVPGYDYFRLPFLKPYVPRADKKEEVSFSRFDLSAREQEIANLLIGGKTNAEIRKRPAED